ncbi:MAG: ribonuclease P protein component, partial [Clostridia bacterium]|nr:ribonuclease P protein component [Clostridia bacterium]
ATEKIFAMENQPTAIFCAYDNVALGAIEAIKKHGKSVKRNRIKRLLRESFKCFAPFVKDGFFFVFLPKVKEEYSLNEFKKDMNYLLKKSGLIEKC